VSSINKGGPFEREICRYLSLWWSNQERDDIFWRNRVRRTMNTPNAEVQLGDIVALDPIGAPLTDYYNIECKTGYSKTRKGKKVKNIPWDILDLIDGKEDGDKVFLNFWEQTDRDAFISKREPLLIFKRDYHKPVVCLEKGNINLLEGWAGKLPLSFIQYFSNDFGHLILIRADDFFDWIPPEIVIAMRNENGY